MVIDNGCGIEPEKLALIREKLADKSLRDVLNVPSDNSLGLVNIHNRLRNHYGDQFGLEIECPPEGGTIVTLLFPFGRG